MELSEPIGLCRKPTYNTQSLLSGKAKIALKIGSNGVTPLRIVSHLPSPLVEQPTEECHPG